LRLSFRDSGLFTAAGSCYAACLMNIDALPRRRRYPAATIVGLGVALLLPLLTSPVVTHFLGAAPSSALITAGLVIHWLTFALLLVIVLRSEREPLH